MGDVLLLIIFLKRGGTKQLETLDNWNLHQLFCSLHQFIFAMNTLYLWTCSYFILYSCKYAFHSLQRTFIHWLIYFVLSASLKHAVLHLSIELDLSPFQMPREYIQSNAVPTLGLKPTGKFCTQMKSRGRCRWVIIHCFGRFQFRFANLQLQQAIVKDELCRLLSN